MPPTKFTGAGKRGEKLEILRPSDPLIRNADGQVIESFDFVVGAWASVIWAETEETLVSNQSQGRRKATFRFPWSLATTALNSSWRLKQKRTGITFGITSSYDLDERTREWVVVAVAIS